MKIFLSLLILIFGLQSFSKADKRKYGHLSLLKSKLASEHGLYEEDVVLFSDWFIAYQIALIHETTFLNQGFRIYIFYINSYSLDEIKSIKDYRKAIMNSNKYISLETKNNKECIINIKEALQNEKKLSDTFNYKLNITYKKLTKKKKNNNLLKKKKTKKLKK